MTEQDATMAARYFRARDQMLAAEEGLDAELCEIFGVPEDEDWWEDFSFDEVDWDGISVEFTDAREGFVPTDEQMAKVWDLGFSVIRIDYKGRARHALSGDWWCVQGRRPMECAHARKPEMVP